MGRYIAKLADDAYVEWSIVVDAPVSWVCARVSAVRKWTEVRVSRADANGTSVLDGYPAGTTPEEIVSGNRAGPDETTLTVEDIIDQYREGDPAPMTEVRRANELVEAEMRKVCERGHSLGWRPWYRSRIDRGSLVLGHCVCGAPYGLEARGPEPLDMRSLAAAGDWVAIEFPAVAQEAERIARVAVRAYLNELPEPQEPAA